MGEQLPYMHNDAEFLDQIDDAYFQIANPIYKSTSKALKAKLTCLSVIKEQRLEDSAHVRRNQRVNKDYSLYSSTQTHCTTSYDSYVTDSDTFWSPPNYRAHLRTPTQNQVPPSQYQTLGSKFTGHLQQLQLPNLNFSKSVHPKPKPKLKPTQTQTRTQSAHSS